MSLGTNLPSEDVV